MSSKYKVILPLEENLYIHLRSMEGRFQGHALISSTLSGFIKNMLVSDFDLHRHLLELEYLEISSYESNEYISVASMTIVMMTIDYKDYFSKTKYESIVVTDMYYDEFSITFKYRILL